MFLRGFVFLSGSSPAVSRTWIYRKTFLIPKRLRPVTRLGSRVRAALLQELLDGDPTLSKAELARRLGVSRSRITQIFRRAAKAI
jgi:AraC-like DNA-binding protein